MSGNGTLLNSFHLVMSFNTMGTLYSITVVIGLACAGVALLIFAFESGKQNLAPKIGGVLAFVVALVTLYYGVEAFLRP